MLLGGKFSGKSAVKLDVCKGFVGLPTTFTSSPNAYIIVTDIRANLKPPNSLKRCLVPSTDAREVELDNVKDATVPGAQLSGLK